MADAIHFKAYLTKANAREDKPEIRRFSVDIDATNFKNLCEKLQSVFPNLKGKHFTISWKDEDNDEIVISSSEELQIALAETASAWVQKIYITLHSNNEEEKAQNHMNFDTPNNSKTKHIGVVCDGCDKGIYGYRYKCLQCTDYDLCNECEKKGLHCEHYMMRISVPLQWNSHYEKRLIYHINKFVRKATSCTTQGESKECPFTNREFSGTYNRRCGQPPTWINTFSTYFNNWANFPAECPPMDSEKNDVDSEQSNSKPNKTPSSSTSEPNTEDIYIYIECLKNVGEQISQFLGPFGIDVNEQVKTDKPSSTITEDLIKKSEDLKKMSNGLTEMFKNLKKKSEDLTKNSVNENTNVVVNEDSHESVKVGQQSDNQPMIPLSTSKSNLIPAIQIVPDTTNITNDEWTLLDGDCSPISSGSLNIYTENITADRVRKISQPTQNEAKVSNSPPPYPANVSDNFWHQIPKIQRAVEAMVQMGFSNEGGRLTQLLVSKNGDISKALDVLTPVK